MSAPQNARVEEGRPWQTHNSDGGPNLGSYEFQAACWATNKAHELIAALTDGPPTPGQILALGHRVLIAADRVQAQVRHDGHTDRMDNSHSRARGAVSRALENLPLPEVRVTETLDEWQAEVEGYAVMVLGVAKRLAYEWVE